MNDTETWAFRSVEGGELYLRRQPGSRWEVNFYERSQVIGNPAFVERFLQAARLAGHYFAGRKFETPDEAAKAVAERVCAERSKEPKSRATVVDSADAQSPSVFSSFSKMNPYLAVAILAFVAGCGETTPRSNRNATRAAVSPSTPTPSETTASPSNQSDAQAIPDDVTYTIIDKNIVPGIKRSLDIRLNRKVSKNVLQAIAMKLKNSDPQTYDRTFIGYYLPDMRVNAEYWATTHFNPNLEVRILGLTAEQEDALKQQPADPSREIIGSWLDERPFVGSRITIFQKDGRLFMENKYRDGSAGIAEIVEKRSPNGRRFAYKPDRGNGEYYLINIKGELQELDQEGAFMTAKKVN
jgi:hypothetical protein